jgi:hypothetical protein
MIAMEIKSSFSPEEWARVMSAPMLAGIAVTAADPGGLWGALKESAAAAGQIAKAGDDGLVGEIVTEYKTADGRDIARTALKTEVKGKKPAEIVDSALTELAEVANMVAAKNAEAGAAYKAWLLDTAQKVAEAGTEGGFMGFGGVKVSDAEKATLEKLASALA